MIFSCLRLHVLPMLCVIFMLFDTYLTCQHSVVSRVWQHRPWDVSLVLCLHRVPLPCDCWGLARMRHAAMSRPMQRPDSLQLGPC